MNLLLEVERKRGEFWSECGREPTKLFVSETTLKLFLVEIEGELRRPLAPFWWADANNKRLRAEICGLEVYRVIEEDVLEVC